MYGLVDTQVHTNSSLILKVMVSKIQNMGANYLKYAHIQNPLIL